MRLLKIHSYISWHPTIYHSPSIKPHTSHHAIKHCQLLRLRPAATNDHVPSSTSSSSRLDTNQPDPIITTSTEYEEEDDDYLDEQLDTFLLQEEEEQELQLEEESIWGPPAILAAGFPVEELAGIRVLLDGLGGQDIPVIPSSSALILQKPCEQAVIEEEPKWEEPLSMNQQLQAEQGGWGKHRVLLFSGIGIQDRALITDLLEFNKISPEAVAVLLPPQASMKLGEVLALALKEEQMAQKQQKEKERKATATATAAGGKGGSRSVSSSSSNATSNNEEDISVPLVDMLPPLDTILKESGSDFSVADTATTQLHGHLHLDDDFIIDRLVTPENSNLPPPQVVDLSHISEMMTTSSVDAIEEEEAAAAVATAATVTNNSSDSSSASIINNNDREGSLSPEADDIIIPSTFNQQEEEEKSRDPVMLPEVDDFVLSKSRLRETAAKYRMDYQTLLQTIEAQGIVLSD